MWGSLNVQPALWMTKICICLRSQRHCVPDRAPRQEATILRTHPPLLLFLRREDSGWMLCVQRRGSKMKAVPTSCVHVQCLKRAPARPPCPSPSAITQKLKLLRHFLFCFWGCACNRKSKCWPDFSEEALHTLLKANKRCRISYWITFTFQQWGCWNLTVHLEASIVLLLEMTPWAAHYTIKPNRQGWISSETIQKFFLKWIFNNIQGILLWPDWDTIHSSGALPILGLYKYSHAWANV